MSLLPAAVFSLSVLGLAGCAECMAACSSVITLQLKAPAGAWQAGRYVLAVESSAEVATCTFDLVAGEPATLSPGPCDGIELDGIGLEASGVATFTARYFGAPDTARLSLTRGDAVLLDRTVEPSYREHRKCGLHCESTRIELELGS